MTAPHVAIGQALLEEVRTLGSAAAPVERSFDVGSAGSYQVRLTDNAFPAQFDSLRLIVVRGAQIIATLDAAGTATFAADAGTYRVHVVGQPAAAAGSGTFGVEVTPATGGAALLLFAEAMNLPLLANPLRLTLETPFDAAVGGTYQVTVADFAFPAPLDSVLLNIVGPGGESVFVPPNLPPAAPGTFTFPAAAGTHQLLLIAEASVSAAAGLVGVRIQGGPADVVVYDQTHAVGAVASPVALTLGAGGAHTLRTTDFSFPVALSQLAAMVARGGSVLARRDTPGLVAFNAAAGAAQVFVLATPSATTPGTYAVEVLSGSDTVYQRVEAANLPGGDGTPGFTYPVDITAAGSYRLTLTDFQFPATLQTLALNISQAGTSLGTLNAAGSLDINPAAGSLFLSVIAQAPNADTSGLFGLQVVPAGGGAPLLDVTQGVGDLFASRTITVANAGRNDVALTDLAFPVAFADLALAVTRGSSRVGSIFGGGTFSFDATPGDYLVSFVATADATQQAGTYGLRVTPTAPAPTVTLTASPANVTSGGTTTLTWSSTNATACTASGGWSGSKLTSGSETSGALTSSSTFSLTCSGGGGSANESVTVSTSAPSSGDGGGGALGVAAVLMLLLLGLRRQVALGSLRVECPE